MPHVEDEEEYELSLPTPAPVSADMGKDNDNGMPSEAISNSDEWDGMLSVPNAAGTAGGGSNGILRSQAMSDPNKWDGMLSVPNAAPIAAYIASEGSNGTLQTRAISNPDEWDGMLSVPTTAPIAAYIGAEGINGKLSSQVMPYPSEWSGPLSLPNAAHIIACIGGDSSNGTLPFQAMSNTSNRGGPVTLPNSAPQRTGMAKDNNSMLPSQAMLNTGQLGGPVMLHNPAPITSSMVNGGNSRQKSTKNLSRSRNPKTTTTVPLASSMPSNTIMTGKSEKEKYFEIEISRLKTQRPDLSLEVITKAANQLSEHYYSNDSPSPQHNNSSRSIGGYLTSFRNPCDVLKRTASDLTQGKEPPTSKRSRSGPSHSQRARPSQSHRVRPPQRATQGPHQQTAQSQPDRFPQQSSQSIGLQTGSLQDSHSQLDLFPRQPLQIIGLQTAGPLQDLHSQLDRFPQQSLENTGLHTVSLQHSHSQLEQFSQRALREASQQNLNIQRASNKSFQEASQIASQRAAHLVHQKPFGSNSPQPTQLQPNQSHTSQSIQLYRSQLNQFNPPSTQMDQSQLNDPTQSSQLDQLQLNQISTPQSNQLNQSQSNQVNPTQSSHLDQLQSNQLIPSQLNPLDPLHSGHLSSSQPSQLTPLQPSQLNPQRHFGSIPHQPRQLDLQHATQNIPYQTNNPESGLDQARQPVDQQSSSLVVQQSLDARESLQHPNYLELRPRKPSFNEAVVALNRYSEEKMSLIDHYSPSQYMIWYRCPACDYLLPSCHCVVEHINSEHQPSTDNDGNIMVKHRVTYSVGVAAYSFWLKLRDEGKHCFLLRESLKLSKQEYENWMPFVVPFLDPQMYPDCRHSRAPSFDGFLSQNISARFLPQGNFGGIHAGPAQELQNHTSMVVKTVFRVNGPNRVNQRTYEEYDRKLCKQMQDLADKINQESSMQRALQNSEQNAGPNIIPYEFEKVTYRYRDGQYEGEGRFPLERVPKAPDAGQFQYLSEQEAMEEAQSSFHFPIPVPLSEGIPLVKKTRTMNPVAKSNSAGEFLYIATEKNESRDQFVLSFKKDELITIIDKQEGKHDVRGYKSWWSGQNSKGAIGWVIPEKLKLAPDFIAARYWKPTEPSELAMREYEPIQLLRKEVQGGSHLWYCKNSGGEYGYVCPENLLESVVGVPVAVFSREGVRTEISGEEVFDDFEVDE